MQPLILHGVKMKVCVDDYADAPEGVPVWCVEQTLGPNIIGQLIVEIAAFIMLFIMSHQFFKYLRRRKRLRQMQEEQLNKSQNLIELWHP